MKSVEEQLTQYKSVHFNKKNIKTHFVGIPLIILALTILLSLYSFSITFFNLKIILSPAIIFFSGVLIYYFVLQWRLALGMVLYIIANLYLASLMTAIPNSYLVAIAIFIVGWIIQFVGHYFEKAKPAFVDDLSQFLIGPFFLMAEIYFYLGLEKKLNKAITPRAIERRRQLEAAKR
ncbi:MAG: YGL010W-like membrane protein [Alteromonadaceae bacterium]|jgi:uncharacterized membrane protein YGL010W